MHIAACNGTHIHYRVDGREGAPALLLVNPIATDLRVWDRVVDILKDEFRIIRFDERGHGLSDTPQSPYTMADETGDIKGLLDHLGVDKALVCGTSVGGLIAQGFYAAYPECVSGLVLCCTNSWFGGPERWDPMMELVAEQGMEALAGRFMEVWFPAAFRSRFAAKVTGWRNMSLRTPVMGFLGTAAVLRDTDLRAAAASIRVPTIVLAGDEDGATTPDIVESFAATIPGARFQLAKGSGHIPSVAAPQAVADAIRNVAKG